MEGRSVHSPEMKQKIKKAKLSKTVGGKVSKKEAILNRMSSGKRRPRSEPRVRKGGEVHAKGDLLAKRLMFQDNHDDIEDDHDDEGKRPSPVQRKKQKRSILKTPQASRGATNGHVRSTSKWQVTDSKPTSEKEKPEKGGSALKGAKGSGKPSSKYRHELDNSDDEEDEEEFDDDDEIDFPVLKRKSLGLDREPFEKSQLMVQGTQIKKQGGKEAKGSKGLEVKEKEVKEKKGGKKDGLRDQQQQADDDDGANKHEGKKKRKKRGKKRKRSNSESEELQAKKGRQAVDEFAVRCGNLPVGTRNLDLSMFLGEADIFPKSITIKTKRRATSGEKKCSIKYATVLCSSAEEVARLCELNGISMPSTVGHRDSRLLIHRMNADSSTDPNLLFKRKLFIRNLHPKIREDDLFEFFKGSNFHPTNVIFPRRGVSKKTKGTALVWLQAPSDVDRAVGLKNPTLRDQVFIIARSNAPTTQEP